MSALPNLRMSVKLYAHGWLNVDGSDLVRVFHRWIQDQTLADQLMIDAANYDHVHGGPGIVLVCYSGHYSFDHAHDRTGLRYEWKRGVGGADPFRTAVRAASSACLLLQEEDAFKDRLRFGTDRILLRVNDRLRAPNTADTLGAVRRQIEPTLARLFADADSVGFEHLDTAKEPFGLEIRIAGGPDLKTLHRRTQETR